MKRTNKGFTLIELMIVVAIIGILAAIAIPNFLRFQLKSKTSEGKVNLSAIRTAEEGYLAEFGTYVTAAPQPNLALDTQKNTWPAGVAAGGFNTIGWAPEGPVFFDYAVAVNGPRYTASAIADIDDDNVTQGWGYFKTDTLANGIAADAAHADCATPTDAPAPNQVGPCDGDVGAARAFGNSIF